MLSVKSVDEGDGGNTQGLREPIKGTGIDQWRGNEGLDEEGLSSIDATQELSRVLWQTPQELLSYLDEGFVKMRNIKHNMAIFEEQAKIVLDRTEAAKLAIEQLGSLLGVEIMGLPRNDEQVLQNNPLETNDHLVRISPQKMTTKDNHNAIPVGTIIQLCPKLEPSEMHLTLSDNTEMITSLFPAP